MRRRVAGDIDVVDCARGFICGHLAVPFSRSSGSKHFSASANSAHLAKMPGKVYSD
jgi:hypothetical protein